ncbi:acyl carrier protein [Streptomyces sp. NPDC006274]|uniref:acyl carrier protein n=1 Tax=unclassified Streptomyces TaxID=2593676 RepID=UPI0033A17162
MSTQTTSAGPASQEYVATLFARLLGVAAPGPDDDFFVLGGTSLSAMDLIALIEQERGVLLPVRDFYRGTSVAELAATLDQLSEASA